jgi:hypothetical protein
VFCFRAPGSDQLSRRRPDGPDRERVGQIASHVCRETISMGVVAALGWIGKAHRFVDWRLGVLR